MMIVHTGGPRGSPQMNIAQTEAALAHRTWILSLGVKRQWAGDAASAYFCRSFSRYRNYDIDIKRQFILFFESPFTPEQKIVCFICAVLLVFFLFVCFYRMNTNKKKTVQVKLQMFLFLCKNSELQRVAIVPVCILRITQRSVVRLDFAIVDDCVCVRACWSRSFAILEYFRFSDTVYWL